MAGIHAYIHTYMHLQTWDSASQLFYFSFAWNEGEIAEWNYSCLLVEERLESWGMEIDLRSKRCSAQDAPPYHTFIISHRKISVLKSSDFGKNQPGMVAKR